VNVRVAFDTSSLLPLVLPAHPRYQWVKPWDEAVRAGRIAGLVLAHARAELFATATAIPGIRITPKAALQVIEELLQGLEVIPGSDEVYRAAVARCALVGVTSGGVYDALHVIAAELAGATAIVTLDVGDFERFRIETSPRIIVPPDGGGLL